MQLTAPHSLPPAQSLAGRRVTLMGLGTHGGGVAAARWLVDQGAVLTITDQAAAGPLQASLSELEDLPVAAYRLGGHCLAYFDQADLVVVNPAVPPSSPWLARIDCRRLTSEVELFLDRCPALVIGVTGTVGKSTTASMLTTLLDAAGRRTWLGGNIGRSLLPHLGEIQPADVVVLELSSFQLHYLSDTARWPEIAVLTNCSPNHLCWHGDYLAYAAAKERLTAHAKTIAMPPAAEGLANWPLPASCLRLPMPAEPLLLGRLASLAAHDRQNAALAVAVAAAVGVMPWIGWEALARYAPLPHRQEVLPSVGGRRFINDSKATTPVAVAAAVDATRGPTWLIAGGIDKGGDWRSVVEQGGQFLRGIALIGQSASRIALQLASLTSDGVRMRTCEQLDAALAWCWEQSQPGDTILLSPGCASFDQFEDYAHRGESFRQAVQALGEFAVGQSCAAGAEGAANF
jgi:UDP-N-acetylmuramoylalanine--D-glutamate ligase